MFDWFASVAFFCERFFTMEKKCSPTKPHVLVAVFITVLLDKGLRSRYLDKPLTSLTIRPAKIKKDQVGSSPKGPFQSCLSPYSRVFSGTPNNGTPFW